MTALAIAALVSWIVAGAMDIYLLSPWLGDKSGIFSQGILAGHLALVLLGLLIWIRFMLVGSVLFAWIAIALLAAAIGLGISIAGRWIAFRNPGGSPQPGRPRAPSAPAVFGITSDEMLARALEDEALTTQLVDDLLASVLSQPQAPSRASRPGLAVAVAPGGLALVTFAFAVLAAVTAG